MDKKIIIKFGTSRESKIFISKNLTKEIDFFINAKNIEHSFKSIIIIIKNKNYFIDSNIHLFFEKWEKDPISSKVKISKNLILVFKEILHEFHENLLFKSQAEKVTYLSTNVKQIVLNSLDYQKNRINLKRDNQEESENNFSKKFLEIDENESMEPQFIISPYFPIGFLEGKIEKDEVSVIDEMIYLNDLFFQEIYNSIDTKKFNIYFCLAFSKHVLENHVDKLSALIQKHTNDNSNFLFWIDDFSFLHGSPNSLPKKISNFISLLKKCGGNSIVLHGDFSLICALNKNITGNDNNLITNSGYGEKRSIFAKGGIPVPSYYLLPLHKKVSMIVFMSFLLDNNFLEENKEKIDKKNFKEKICKCDNCEVLISKINEIGIFQFQKIFTGTSSFLNQKQKVLLSFSKDLLISHFAFAKQEEIKFLDLEPEKFISELENWERNIEDYSFEVKENWFKNSEIFIRELKKMLEEKTKGLS